jgi:hypothetical protein
VQKKEHIYMVGLHISPTTTEIIMEVPQQTENRIKTFVFLFSHPWAYSQRNANQYTTEISPHPILSQPYSQ